MRSWKESTSIGTQCQRKETLPSAISGNTAVRGFGNCLCVVDFLHPRIQVIQGCNPPDNIFFVALPFKLFGIKYVFDHHDANPDYIYSKV